MENNIDDTDIINSEEDVNPKNDEQELGLPEDKPEVEPKDEAEGLPDDPEELKQMLRETKEQQQQTYEQLKKAKGFKRDPKTGKWVKPETKPQGVIDDRVDKTSSDITIMELKSLLAANIHDDSDTEEVRLYARSHKISITDALKLPEVKSMLRTRIDQRNTAEATSTSSTRRSPNRVSDDILIREMESGKIPEDPAEAARLRYEKKKREIENNKK